MNQKHNNYGGIRTFIPQTTKDTKKYISSPWYLKVYELVELLSTNTEKGLTLQEAQKRRKKSGFNLLYPEFKRTFRSALMDHIKAVSSVLLAISLFIYFAFLKQYEYLLSAAIVTFSIIFDCILEHSSSVVMAKTRKNAALKALVKRNGTFYSTDSRFLVPGDIVFVKKGSIVPADIRLFDSNGLTVYETPINSSEEQISKIAKDIYEETDYTKETPINMIFAGSIVTEGNGWGIVCSTGRQTRFTNMPKNKHDIVPSIFKYVFSVSSMLSIISALFGALMLIIGLFFSSSLTNSFLFALTIASCSLCDSIVSFSSLSFSTGLYEMKKNGAVLRNLSSVESLTFVDTLLAHQNTLFPIQKTELEKVFIGQHIVEGELEKKIIKYFLLCSDAKKNLSKKEKKSTFYGKKNAVAAAEYAESIGINIENNSKDFLVTEMYSVENDEFSSLLAYENGQKYLFIKGSALDVLPLCKYHVTMQGTKTLSQNDVDDYEDFIISNTSETGYLVALAKCETAVDKLSEYDNRRILTLYGFIRFKTYFGIDYLKDVSESHKASIDVCMFSSDSYVKAYNLGKNSGIFQDNSQVITEEELKYISKNEFETNLPFYRLFLNFSSQLFDKIVLKKKKEGKTVAVSAESTNDLLIMKNSNVSFVVDGESSEMIKQSSDVILSTGGFDKINNVIFTSKKIYRRIHTICEYSVYNYLSILFLYFLGTIFGIDYRVHDFLIFSILFSGIISLFIATAPIQHKFNFNKPRKRKNVASPISFFNSICFSSVCAVCCVVLELIYKNQSPYSVSLITFSLFSLFSSIIILNDGKNISKSTIGINFYTLVPLFLLSLSIVLLIELPFFSSLLAYQPITLSAIITSTVVSALTFIILPFILKIIKSKKRV